MADYCTLAEVKAYIGTALSTDDAELSRFITQASARIDRYCDRHFTAVTQTRTFDAIEDIDYRTLYVDDDLLTVTTLTNGTGETIAASSYVLLPANVTPKYAIKLKRSFGAGWNYSVDPEDAISVAGTWGYQAGSVPPDDIKHAAIRLAAWYYAQKSAPFETQGMPELGIVSVPSTLPEDVQSTLAPYVRTRVS